MTQTIKTLYLVASLFVAATLSMAKSSAGEAAAQGGVSGMTARDIFRKTASQWSGDIFLLPKRFNYMLDASNFDQKNWLPSTINGRPFPPHPINMHGVAWDYDLRIPLAFYDPSGRWFKPGSYQNLAVQQDIVPTLAHILDVPAPAKRSGRVLMEAVAAKPVKARPRAIVIFVQDQVGLQYFAAHRGKAPFYELMMAKGSNFSNAAVAHVDVETSVGHASIGTGAWPSEHGIAGNNFFHRGIWQTIPAQMILGNAAGAKRTYNSSFYFTPTLSDVWSVTRSNKPVILSVSSAARASISMGGHGTLFSGGQKSHVVWTEGAAEEGGWTTEETNYALPKAFAHKPILPWVKKLADTGGRWRGHALMDPDGSVREGFVGATPAQVRQQGDLTRQAVNDLKIGSDEETDLVWINFKSTDYCGHGFGYESDECGEVLAAADDEARQIVDQIAQQTDGSYVAILTADHGATPLAELSGGYRIDRTKLLNAMNAQFDKRDNHIDAVQLITSSQVFVNRAELQLNGFAINDAVTFLKNYKATMAMPYNALADEWIKKGKARESLFFEDVIAADDLVDGAVQK